MRAHRGKQRAMIERRRIGSLRAELRDAERSYQAARGEDEISSATWRVDAAYAACLSCWAETVGKLA